MVELRSGQGCSLEVNCRLWHLWFARRRLLNTAWCRLLFNTAWCRLLLNITWCSCVLFKFDFKWILALRRNVLFHWASAFDRFLALSALLVFHLLPLSLDVNSFALLLPLSLDVNSFTLLLPRRCLSLFRSAYSQGHKTQIIQIKITTINLLRNYQ